MTVSSSFQNSPLEAAKQRILQAIEQGLTEVSLANLGLTDLPAGLCELLAEVPGLRSLDLAGNAIAQLPEGVARLTSLQVLSLKGNPLTALSESLGQLTELRVLDISETGVGVLPGGLQRLVEARSLMVIQDVEETTRGYDVFTPVLRGPSGGRTPKGLGWEDDLTADEVDRTVRSTQPDIRAQLSRVPSSQPESQTRSPFQDWINTSVFSPRQVVRGDTFLVQVFAYLPEQIEAVKEMAQMVDETTEQVAKKKLGMPVERDTDLVFELEMQGLEIDDPVQSLRWQGNEDSVVFGVSVPVGVTKKTIIGTVTVSQHSVPMGHLKFRVTVGAYSDEPSLAGEGTRRYKKAFVSYSSKDRAEVLKRVQGMRAVSSLEVFQDLLELEPGQRWERELYRNIDECDLFLLFWSTAARESEWVLKEALYALELQKEDDSQIPAIKPVILEGPPIVPPPEELEDLHFNDWLIYLINQS
ncbi:MAG: TIR domain-containing protein [Cyanobacteria bacterium P01_F01_bin.53]